MFLLQCNLFYLNIRDLFIADKNDDIAPLRSTFSYARSFN